MSHLAAHMPRRRVLIASDQYHWTVNYLHGYRAHGWECIVGIQNFNAEALEVDVVHLNWPEEFSGWKPPSEDQVGQIAERLMRWKKRAQLILTVNNLYPHESEADPAYRRLYERFFELADVIHHLSEVSEELVNARYPAAQNKRSVVTPGFNYDLLLPREPETRETSRAQLGIRPKDIVFLFFGAVRSADELDILRRGISRLRLPDKCLVSSINLVPRGRADLRWRWKIAQWRRWLKRTGAISSEGFIPDEKIHRLFNACDVVVVVRREGLTSGLPSLALTMSRLVVAPRLGATQELLSDTGNLLYDPADPDDFLTALEKAARMERGPVETSNRHLAQSWSWPEIIRKCLEAL